MKLNKKLTLLFIFVLMFTARSTSAELMKSNDPAGTPYQALIWFAADVLRWRDLTGNRTTEKFQYGLGYEPMGLHTNNDDFGYFLTDVDGDGSDELIFSYYWDYSNGRPESTAEIWDLFTVKDDQIVHPAQSIARGLYRLCSNGLITYQGSASAFDGQTVFYRLRNGELELVQNLFIISDFPNQTTTKYYLTTQTNEYFTSGSALPSDAKELSKSEWEEIRNSCEGAQMELVPFLSGNTN